MSSTSASYNPPQTNTGSGGTINFELSNTQPDTPNFWRNNGVLTYWDGVNNNVVDFNDGEVTDVFDQTIPDLDI